MSEFGIALLQLLDREDLANLQARMAIREPTQTTTEEMWITTSEAAARLGVCVDTVRRQILSGALPAQKVGSQYRIKLCDLDSLGVGPSPASTPTPRARRRQRSGRSSGVMTTALINLKSVSR